MNFNRLARWYDLMEGLLAGSLLERARAALLEEIDGCRGVERQAVRSRNHTLPREQNLGFYFLFPTVKRSHC